jgi:hypothetical protein
MKLRHLGLLVLLGLDVARGSEHFDRVDQKALDLMGLSIKSELSIVGADRSAVIARLREVATRKINHIGTASLSADNAQIVLMRLGDDQTIKQVIEEYRQYNSQYALAHVPDMLEWSHQPRAIPYLAQDFYLNDDPSAGVVQKPDVDFGTSAPARSIFSAIISLEIIKRAPEFAPSLKTWAKDAYQLRLKNPKAFRAMMKFWWDENKNAFLSKSCDAVQAINLKSFE